MSNGQLPSDDFAFKISDSLISPQPHDLSSKSSVSCSEPIVKLIILGGAAEVGKNMFLCEYDDDIIIVDCGVGFPGEDQPGIDLVLPDISYLREHRHQIRAIFITHGHEDHIGGLPYLLPEINAPLYATKLTLGLIKVKLQETGILNQADLHEIDPESWEPIQAGVFSVEPFRVCHSIPDAVGFGITTPAGLIVHTSDFKFDPTPIDGRKTDYAKLRNFRERGVRLLMSDCVHIETAGRTPSELIVGETYDRVFAGAGGRILIATFASLIARIQQIIDTAAVYERKVATLGRSLENNVRVAMELGYLTDPDHVLIDAKEVAMLSDNRIVYIVTGSQGEPMAVLSRIANGDHREVEVGQGDTVIISATPIPGNETSVFRIINHLFRAGAEVIYPARALVHVSGHASREELREMIDLLQPLDVLPFHGEHRHMALYADLAIEQGIPVDRITFAEIGDVVEITPKRVEINQQIDAGYVYVDGGSVGEIGESVIRDRRTLAREGMLMVIVSVDRKTGEIVAGPEIVTRGFVHVKESQALLAATKAHIRQELEQERLQGNIPSADDWNYLSRRLREITSSYLYRETRRRPMILPMVLDI